MKQLILAERSCVIAHIVSMAFGLAGLLIVVPHPELIAALSEIGQTVFQWSMAGGGVAYIILGAAAVSIYAIRLLGVSRWLSFFIPATLLSLSSELLGTSTGFPFGEYGYLSGLGYKVAGLVPFTIPLSWFYMGFCSYLLARVALRVDQPKASFWRQVLAILFGAGLLTAWDFALDPAMSQTIYPFWHYGEVGAFFGTPYQNFVGWLCTGTVFMSVAAFLWRGVALRLQRSQLSLAVVVYLSNFAFGAFMSFGAGIWIPVLLGLVVGVLPVLACWLFAPDMPSLDNLEGSLKEVTPFVSETKGENVVSSVTSKVSKTALPVTTKL